MHRHHPDFNRDFSVQVPLQHSTQPLHLCPHLSALESHKSTPRSYWFTMRSIPSSFSKQDQLELKAGAGMEHMIKGLLWNTRVLFYGRIL